MMLRIKTRKRGNLVYIITCQQEGKENSCFVLRWQLLIDMKVTVPPRRQGSCQQKYNANTGAPSKGSSESILNGLSM